MSVIIVWENEDAMKKLWWIRWMYILGGVAVICIIVSFCVKTTTYISLHHAIFAMGTVVAVLGLAIMINGASEASREESKDKSKHIQEK